PMVSFFSAAERVSAAMAANANVSKGRRNFIGRGRRSGEGPRKTRNTRKENREGELARDSSLDRHVGGGVLLDRGHGGCTEVTGEEGRPLFARRGILRVKRIR